MKAGILALLMAGATTVVVASCASQAAPFEPLHTAAGYVVYVANDSPISLTAELQGTLTLIGDTCFALDDEQGVHLLVFPSGTSLVEGEDAVDVPGLGVIELDDQLSGSGGVTGNIDLGSVPDACRADQVALLAPFP